MCTEPSRALIAALLLLILAGAGADEDRYSEERAAMVTEVEQYAQLFRDDGGDIDRRVLDALASVERHRQLVHT